MTDARAVEILRAVLDSNGELDVAEDVARELMRFCLVALDDREALVAVMEASGWWSDTRDAAKRHMRGES